MTPVAVASRHSGANVLMMSGICSSDCTLLSSAAVPASALRIPVEPERSCRDFWRRSASERLTAGSFSWLKSQPRGLMYSGQVVVAVCTFEALEVILCFNFCHHNLASLDVYPRPADVNIYLVCALPDIQQCEFWISIITNIDKGRPSVFWSTCYHCSSAISGFTTAHSILAWVGLFSKMPRCP